MSRSTTITPDDALILLLRTLKLPGFVDHHVELAKRAEKESWGFVAYLKALCEVEVEERRQRRIERIMAASSVPLDKTMATLDQQRLPAKVRRQLPALAEGGFIERAENILCFGLPGRGKTHLCCAVANELMLRGYRVLFAPTCIRPAIHVRTEYRHWCSAQSAGAYASMEAMASVGSTGVARSISRSSARRA